MTRILRAVLLLGVVVACAGPELPRAGRVPGAELPLRSSALVLTVSDAEGADGEPVPFTGDALQALLRTHFTDRGWEVFSASTGSRVAGEARARELQLEHVLEAAFLSWNEAKVDFRKDPDRLSLEIRLRRVSDGALVAYARGERRGESLADVDGRTRRLLAPLVEELLEEMLDGRVLAREPRLDEER